MSRKKTKAVSKAVSTVASAELFNTANFTSKHEGYLQPALDPAWDLEATFEISPKNSPNINSPWDVNETNSHWVSAGVECAYDGELIQWGNKEIIATLQIKQDYLNPKWFINLLENSWHTIEAICLYLQNNSQQTKTDLATALNLKTSNINDAISLAKDIGLFNENGKKISLAVKASQDTYLIGLKVIVSHHKEKYYSNDNWGIIVNSPNNQKVDVKMGDRFIIAVDIADISSVHTIEGELCDNLTCAVESEPDLHLQDSAQDGNLLESQKLTNTAQTSSPKDSPMSITMEMCDRSQCEKLENNGDVWMSLQQVHHVNPSPLMANDSVEVMNETVSPQCLKLSSKFGPNSSVSKTSLDYLPAPTTKENHQVHILEAWSQPLTASGTMHNGLLSVQDTLEPPSLEKDYFWLESPGALSSIGNGRPPGQSKLEVQLKKLGLLQKIEVLNPAILSDWYSLPPTWLDPLECRPATELLEECERQQEIFLIPESQQLQFKESAILQNLQELSTPKNKKQQYKVITIRQPHASLIGLHKGFETRDRATNYRGLILIHAAIEHDDTKDLHNNLQDLLPSYEELPFGSIVAIAQLTDCIKMTDEFIAQQSQVELRCGNWKVGRYAWKLEDVQFLPEPIPARGMPGLWNIELEPLQIEGRRQKTEVEEIPHLELVASGDKNFVDKHRPKLRSRCRIVNNNQQIDQTDEITSPSRLKKFTGQEGYVCGYHTDESLEFWVKLDNFDLQLRVFSHEVEFTGEIQPDFSSGNQITYQGKKGIFLNYNGKFKTALIRLDVEGDKEVPITDIQLIDQFLGEKSEPPKSRKSGSLYPYLENKKLKNGDIVTYPRIDGDRDKDNPLHWNWGYCWEEKIDGEWKNKSIRVPKRIFHTVQQMIDRQYSVEEIRNFIVSCKPKKNENNLCQD